MTKLNNLDSEIQILDEKRQMRNLVNAIKFADSFSLLFVRCNQRPRQKEIIEELVKQLDDYKIKIIFLEHQIEHLLDELQTRLGDEKYDAVFVYGLESSFPKANEAAESKFVVTLNHSRNSFKKVLNCPLVLFLPEYALSAIYHGATDFYSIRSGVYLFSAKAVETEQLISKYSSQEFTELEGLLFEERQNRIKTIENLLNEYQSLPNSQCDFEKENKLKLKLAALYSISNNYAVAATIYQQIIEATRKSKSYILLGEGLNCLASVYAEQNKYKEAINLYKEAIEVAEKTIGRNHINYAICLDNLASVYTSQRKYNKSTKLILEALDIFEKTIGTNNPEYATILNNLATLYKLQGRYKEALNLFEESLNIVKETLGKNHINYASCLNNLAVLYMEQEKYQLALNIYKEAYRIWVKILGRNHYQAKKIYGYIETCQIKLKNKAKLPVPYKN